MPEVDFALIGDYVRSESGVAHVISAAMDTVWAPEVPTGQNIGFLSRILFSRHECGRPHRIELIFQGADGDRLLEVGGIVEPPWPDGHPPGWPVGVLWAVNLGIPLPRHGQYSFEMLVNDSQARSIRLQVVKPRP